MHTRDSPTDPPADSPTYISLFSGGGGSSLGYEHAGFTGLAAVDCAPDGYADAILDTYRSNHETPLYEYDVRNIDGESLLGVTGLDRGELDLLDGSPPCSPFSEYNRRGEKGFQHTGGTLFDEYVRLVDAVEPKYFVAENVPSLATGKTIGYFKDLCARLRAAGRGYDLAVSEIEAHKLGAPHRRTRLMFVGSRVDMPTPNQISYTHTTTLREALRGVENEQWELDFARNRLNSSSNGPLYKRLEPGQYLADLPETEGRYGYSHLRLPWDRPSNNPTSSIEFVHPSQNRFITISELKRIIGLPDDYEIAGASFNQQWECTIRCLPPILLETIGNSIRDALGPGTAAGGETETSNAVSSATPTD